MRRHSITLALVTLLAGLPLDGGTAAPTGPPVAFVDPQATEIALRALAAVERGWALARYDQAGRVRAAINLRGTNGLGVTANLAFDRANRRWRLDTAGDVGPLTLYADAARATLYVPSLVQFATRAAGFLAPSASVGRSLTAEVAAMRRRLEAGYAPLVYRGEEMLDGTPVHVLVDTPEPGTTTTFWIDARTSLPRRVAVAAAGGRDIRLDFGYRGSARPASVTATFVGPRPVRLDLVPGYDDLGRVRRLGVSGRMADGTGIDADVNLIWSPRFGPAHFRFEPPAGVRQVSFQQLASGVLFTAAAKLGPLVSIFMGTR
jgi:hypothetical protein